MTTASGKMCVPLISQVLNPSTQGHDARFRGRIVRDGLLCSRPGQELRPFRASCQKATI